MLFSGVLLWCYINACLLKESKISFLVSSAFMFLRRHRAFSVKVRAKMHSLVPEYAGKCLHQPPQPAKGRLNV